MSAIADAPALAGIAQNARFPMWQRLQCSKQALDAYIAQTDQLHELLEYCERQRTGNPNADQAVTWGHAGALLQKIVSGEPTPEFDRLRRALDGE